MPPKKDIKDAEEKESNGTGPSISFRDVEKSMTSFSGDDTYPILTWFEEFEDTAHLMNWSEIEKLIYAKRLLTGTAKLFLRGLGGVKEYSNLKQQLTEEFGPKLNSAAIHKKLSSRKMKKDETYQQYFLHMKECALHGNIEDAALIEYVIDGIQDSECNKTILYGATNLKEFRTKLETYKNIKEKTQTRPNVATPFANNNKVKRCFKCGDLDHQAPACTKGVKCFRCNEYGHKGTECSNEIKKMLHIHNKDVKAKIYEEYTECTTPYKKIKINDFEMTAFIDTGSDVNLIKLSHAVQFMTEKGNYDKEKAIHLTGIAGNELRTEGLLKAQVMVDDYYVDMEFHVVQDYAIPVNVILGNPLLKDFEINFTTDGVFFKKITYLTLLAAEKNTVCDEHYAENKVIAEKISKIVEEYKPNNKKKESSTEIKTNPENKGIAEKITKIVEEYKPDIRKMETSNEMKRVLTEEDPIHQGRLSPLEMKVVDKEVKESLVDENIPKKMQNEMKRKKHVYEHLGIRKTEELVSREYIIENLKEKIKKIDNCKECVLIGTKMKDENEEIIRLIEEEEIMDHNERKNELRKEAKESIQKIQEENVRTYNRKRKKTTEYNVGKHHERYAFGRVGDGERPINTTTSADLMKSWADVESHGYSSGSDE